MRKLILTIAGCASCMFATAQATYSLEQILDSARRNNIAIRNGRRDISAAREQRKEVYTKYFPTVSGTGVWFNSAKSLVSADLNPSDIVSSSLASQLPAEALAALSNPISISLIKDGVLGGITAVQPVYAGGRIVNGNRLAKVGEESTQLRLRLSENEVDKNAEQYYWQIVSLEEKMKTVESMERLLADIHKDVDIAVRAGVRLRNDLLQVELRQNDVESQKLKISNGISLVRMLLAQYCGLQDTSFTVSYSSETVSPSSLREDHVRALPRTAEYQLLGKQVEAADLQRKITLGENLPSVGIGVGASYNNLLDHSRTNAMVFATVSIPISDWWGGTHAVRRRKIEYQKAVDERRDKSELLIIRMQNAWNDVVEAYKQLDIAERSIEQSTENLRLNRDFYKAGTITMSDLLEAQMLYQQSCDSRTNAFAVYQNCILAYKQAVGL